MWNNDEFNNFVKDIEHHRPDNEIAEHYTEQQEKDLDIKNSEEINNYIDKQTHSANKKESKVVVENQDNPIGIPKGPGSPMYIDLEAINNNNKVLENSEALLAIFEVTSNQEHYGLGSASNKSRGFWDKLSLVKSFEKVLTVFKTETLRKYWRILDEVKNKKQLIECIKKHSKAIDNTSMRLLTIITVLKDYLSGRVTDLEKTLAESGEKTVTQKTGKSYKRNQDDDDESFDLGEKEEIKKSKSMLNNKRKIPNIEEEKLENVNKNIEMVNNVLNNTNDLKAVVGKRNTRNKGNTSLFSEEDKRVFSEIETIVETLQKQVPEAAEFEIWDALKRNSFNIINTYLYLMEPETYDGKIISYFRYVF